MLDLKSKDELNSAQLRCFEVPRADEELYDIVTDPNELNNLAGNSEHEEALEEMRKRLAKRRDSTDDYIPNFRTTDKFDRKTGKPYAPE
jgi:N-sulfoglucosamine sulfohydrolase